MESNFGKEEMTLGENLESQLDLEFEETVELRKKYNNYILSLSDKTPMNDNLDLSLIYPETLEKEELLAQVDDLKKCLDSFRPLSPTQAKNLEEAFDVEYTYDSNRIEGNTMTLSETALVLKKGMTISGKSVQEHLEVINHNDALEYIKDLVQGHITYSEKELLKIHSFILQGIDRLNAGFYRHERVFITGSRHVPPNPLKVPNLMEEYFRYFSEHKDSEHPVILAADMSEKLVTIHPFVDGNGRTSRLIMNLLLMQAGYPITIISSEKNSRDDYYSSLETVQLQQDKDKFRIFVLCSVKQTLFRYLNAVSINGNSEEQGKGGYFFRKIQSIL